MSYRAALICLAALGVACRPQPTSVAITIAAPGLAIHDLAVDVAFNGQRRASQSVPASGGRPSLPSVVMIELPDVAAAVTMTIKATSDQGVHYVASITIASQPHQQKTATVTLGSDDTGDMAGADMAGADMEPTGGEGGDMAGADMPKPAVPSLTLLAGLPGSNQNDWDATGRDARFAGPWGIVYAGNGTLYVSDEVSGTIRKLDAAGNVTTLPIVDSVGQTFRFNQATGMAFDGANTLYVAELGNNDIRKVDLSTNQVSPFAGQPFMPPGSGDGAAASATFKQPLALALDPSGTTLWVADTGNATLRSISLGATPMVSTPLGVAGDGKIVDGAGGATNPARLKQPNAVTFIGSTLWVGDATALRKVTPGNPAQIATVEPEGNWSYLNGIADDGAGNVIVSDSAEVIHRVVPGPPPSFLNVAGAAFVSNDVDGMGAVARFTAARMLTGDGAGTLWMVDDASVRRIQVANWNVTTIAGTVSHAGTTDQPPRLSGPTGIAWDGADTVYIAQYFGDQIRTYHFSTRALRTLAGNGRPGTSDGKGMNATFGGPTGIALDNNGKLWVSDYDTHIIRTVALDGSVTTVAGMPNRPGLTNDVGLRAQFNNPNGMVFDGAHTLYISDSNNNVIRTLDTDTMAVSTFAGTGVVGTDDNSVATSATFSSPHGIVLDHMHNLLYVCDGNAGTIRSIDMSPGTHAVTRIAGVPYANVGLGDGVALSATFHYPNQIALDVADQILYIADAGENAVRRLDINAAMVSTYVGVGGPALTKLGPLPAAVATPWGVLYTSRGLLITSIAEHSLLVAQ
jgi:sugar lactone lactonase YvrE